GPNVVAHERHYTGPTLWHLLTHSWSRSFTLALLAVLTSGCVQNAPVGAPLSPVSPTAIPIPLPSFTPIVPTEQVPTSMPTQACTEQAGSLQTGMYRGIAVAQDIPYAAYLPPCYGASEERYPTLYLLHGYPYDEAHWSRLGAIEIADDRIGAGEWPAFIMVMPLQPEPLYRSSDGGPGSYETEFLEGLVPFIEGNYRSNPSERALAGVSRGGVWALEIGLRNPMEFASVAALSPALAVNSARPPYDPFEIVASSDRFPPNILLLAGDDDWAAVETERLSRVLGDAGVEHTFQITAGDHSDTTWAAVVSDVLGFLVLQRGP
ncbi:MAG: alpha/beta hydrolase, partial [Anaerolineales bacterium]